MGGSGVSGDLLAIVAGPFMPVPVVVVKGYEPPSYVNDRTLVFAMSFSGDTEETVEAVTTAANAGGRIVAVTRGGALAEPAGRGRRRSSASPTTSRSPGPAWGRWPRR